MNSNFPKNLPPIGNIKPLDFIAKEFEKSPGPFSYGLKDISLSQFVLNPKIPRNIHLVDTCFVDIFPGSLAVMEYGSFFNLFDSEGLVYGLQEHEVVDLQKAFSQGYQKKYKGLHLITPGAKQFADLYSTSDTLRYLIEEMLNGNDSKVIRNEFKRYTDIFNNKMKLIENTRHFKEKNQ